MVAIQNHIHLDTAVGGAPENAPTATYRILFPNRRIRDKVNLSFNRGENGTPHVSRQRKTGGAIIRYRDLSYTLKVTDTEYGALLAILGETVSVVDSYHPDDGEDHDSYVRTMLFVDMPEPKMANVKAVYYEVDVFLQDMDSHL